MGKFDELQKLVAQMEKDFEEYYVHHDKAAGERFRKEMQMLKSLAEDIRVAISVNKNE